jgi:hypothetical protein
MRRLHGREVEMKKIQTLGAAIIACCGLGTASGDTMECGTHEIMDGQIPGQTRAQIKAMCGTPQDSSGDDLFYERGGRLYRLHFNDNDELESIVEQPLED